MEEHYLAEQHQQVIMNFARQVLLQLNDKHRDNDLSRMTTAETCSLAAAQVQELYEMLDILSGSIEALNNDQQHLSNESLQVQIALPTLTEELSKIKLSVEESNAFLEGMKYNQEILKQEFASLQEKINDLQNVSYDGTLVWRITNVKEKMSMFSNYPYVEL
ncbi:unnamed protein product [Rotaria sp. Silwood2]|nr:unnamed protein product [Rotaria sp. Silwood2]